MNEGEPAVKGQSAHNLSKPPMRLTIRGGPGSNYEYVVREDGYFTAYDLHGRIVFHWKIFEEVEEGAHWEEKKAELERRVNTVLAKVNPKLPVYETRKK